MDASTVEVLSVVCRHKRTASVRATALPASSTVTATLATSVVWALETRAQALLRIPVPTVVTTVTAAVELH